MSIDKNLKQKLTDYEVVEIAPKIFKINEYNLSTMFVVLGKERALAVDCGVGVGDFKALVEKLTDGLPYDMVLTHGHVDHAGGRDQFSPIYVHADDKAIIKDATVLYRKFYLLLMKFLGFKSIGFKRAAIKRVKTEPELIGIEEGHIFELGGRTVEVISSKGHTLGSICLLLKEDRILLSGDTLNPQMLMFLPHSTTIEAYAETLKKIMDKTGYDVMWPSHLSEALPRSAQEELYSVTQKILKNNKRNTLLPWIAFSKVNGTVIINRKNHIRERKK